MIALKVIAAPLVGGVIGLVTNGIAIKMLFRPFYPVKIGKFVLPFTPGLIPKEKARLAKAIGNVVGAELLDTETLTKALASEKIQKALYRKIDQIIDNLGQEERTFQEFLQNQELKQAADQAVGQVGEKAGQYVAEYLVEKQIGQILFDYAMQEVMANMNGMILMMAQPALERAREPLLLKIDELIMEKCPELVEGYIGKEYENWMERPVKDLAVHLWSKKDVIREKIWECYLTLLEKKGADFFRKLDVASIVEDKINEFDLQELEKIIMDISRKELNALVWFGGLLGMVIGFINLLV